jgi:hypothetical protein
MERLDSQFIALAMVLMIVLGPVATATWLMLRQRRVARAARRSPLTKQLLRLPGHTLREQLEQERVNLAFDVMVLMAIPGLILVVLYTLLVVEGQQLQTGTLAVAAGGVLAFSLWWTRSLLKRSEALDQLRLGLDAETAAGQELDQLMRQGAAVFHDLAGEHFNVDHVVVAAAGVFAVETKGYRKPIRNGGTADSTVVYDGRALKFPGWSSDKPIKQAERQARWLGEFLTSATGEKTEVTPVLALPGWFVDRQGRGPVMVLSGRELQMHLLKTRASPPLSPKQVQRIAHQVEQRCRNVSPSYRPDEGQDVARPASVRQR